MKNNGVVTIDSRYGTDSSEVIDAGVAELFSVDLHNYKYMKNGRIVKTGDPITDIIAEGFELVEPIHQPVEETKQSAFEVRAEFPATEPPKFPEHWDTRAQMEAIITRTRKFNNGDINPTDMAREVSDLAFRDGVEAGIAYERERCIGVCQAMRPPGGRAWTPEQSACFDALTIAAENIRNGVDPWAGRPERVKQKALEALERLSSFCGAASRCAPEDLKETCARIKAGLDLAP